MNVKTKKSTASKLAVPTKKAHGVPEFSKTSDIHIIVEGFENIHGKHQASEIFVQAEFLGIVIGESPQQPISHDDFIPHNFHCLLRFYPEVRQCIDDLVSNPIVFNVHEVEGIYDTEHVLKPVEEVISQSATSAVKSSKLDSSKKQTDTKSKSGGTSSKKTVSSPQMTSEIIGRCNMDLLPILLGKNEVKETITILPDNNELDDTVISENSLPRLRAILRAPEPILSALDLEDGNVMEFSVESLYNVSDIMLDSMYYTLATILPLQTEAMEGVLIRDGIMKYGPDLEKPKIWPGLAGLETRACYSKYRFDKDILSIKNTLQIDIQNTIDESEKRIEWNIMRRIWLRDDSKQTFVEKLQKYRKWPIEILGTKVYNQKELAFSSSSEIPIVTPSPIESPPNVDKNDIHFMGFLDLTKLLYTGVDRTRVICQLHTFNGDELKFETGHNVVFKDSFSGMSAKTKASTTKKKKGDASTTDVDGDTTIAETDITSLPLKSGAGDPTFIIIEVKLLTPFYEKMSIENLEKHLSEIIPKRKPINQQIVNIQMAEKEFAICVENIIHIIHKEYNDFMEKKSTQMLYNLTGDDETDFVLFINETGANYCFKKTLKKRIYHLICEKFPYTGSSTEVNITEMDKYIDQIYVYLIKKINTIINSFIGPTIGLETCDQHDNESIVSNTNQIQKLLYYAKEAEENDFLNIAERYYLELIDEDKKNTESWLYYAIFKLNNNEIEESYAACRECLMIDSKYKYGLILLGLIMYRKKNYKQTETCFHTLTTYYPNYLLGWVTFHLFYLAIENYEGSDVTHERITKLLENEEPFQIDTAERQFEYLQELSWNIQLWEKHQVYARCAVLLLKLKCYNFVEIALAQDLLTSSDKKCYSYYSSVASYLSKRYDSALNSIEDVLKIVGPNTYVGGLFGYCNYKLNNYETACECFESILYTFNRATDTIFIYTQLCHIYRKLNKLDEALKCILLACKYTPTPYTWLLAGIIYDDLNDLENAELCLNESNFLDNKLSETWKYLSIINEKLGNVSEAEQCLQYAIKNEIPPYKPTTND